MNPRHLIILIVAIGIAALLFVIGYQFRVHTEEANVPATGPTIPIDIPLFGPSTHPPMLPGQSK